MSLRYLVFSGDNYYPSGGWYDYRGGAETLEEAFRIVGYNSEDWWHIVDLEKGDVIRHSGDGK